MKWPALVVLLAVVLSACDPAETIYIKRANEQPVLCDAGEETTYEVLYPVTHPDNRSDVMYEERARFVVEPDGGALSTNPDRVSIDILEGSLESGRVPWFQFFVYCGDSEDAILITPKLTKEDLKHAGKDYWYVVE